MSLRRLEKIGALQILAFLYTREGHQANRTEFETNVDAALLRPLYDKCVDCYYYVQRACQGACLAYKRMPSTLLVGGERSAKEHIAAANARAARLELG